MMGHHIPSWKIIRTFDIGKVREFTFVAEHFGITACTWLNVIG